MQTTLSRIWTWVINSIYYHDSRYTKDAMASMDVDMYSFLFYKTPKHCVEVKVYIVKIHLF